VVLLFGALGAKTNGLTQNLVNWKAEKLFFDNVREYYNNIPQSAVRYRALDFHLRYLLFNYNKVTDYMCCVHFSVFVQLSIIIICKRLKIYKIMLGRQFPGKATLKNSYYACQRTWDCCRISTMINDHPPVPRMAVSSMTKSRRSRRRVCSIMDTLCLVRHI